MEGFVLAVDQGTTSTRALLFAANAKIVSSHSLPLNQTYPHKGWVEQDPEQMFSNVVQAIREVCAKGAISFKQIGALGITNQRETTIIWERKTGRAIYPAIVWQDRRTHAYCDALKAKGHEPSVQAKTGLFLDPYFSASKIRWLLEHVPQSHERALRGELAFGTVDSYLLWRLTGGKEHATDVTNASRTMLYDIHQQKWDDELLQLFDIPRSILPEVKDCADDYGITALDVLPQQIPIRGVIGDQQAAMFGQACFAPGAIKSTYGTGCFMMLNTGKKPMASKNKLLTTIGYKLDGEVFYALEGSIFMAGAIIQWLRDSFGIIKTAAESADLVQEVTDNNGVYLVPAFTGLGAPYWQPNAKAAIVNLTRESNRAHVVRAGLEAVCYQTRDLLEAIIADVAGVYAISELRVDGGMISNSWLMQYLADILALPINCSKILETTARGAAFMAGLNVGVYTSLEQLVGLIESGSQHMPRMASLEREKVYSQWQQAVAMVLRNCSEL